MSKGSWGASPSPLVSDHAGGAGAGEGLALPKYVCYLATSEEFWLGAELRDYILGDPSWVSEVCIDLESVLVRNRAVLRSYLRSLDFEAAMKLARAILLSKSWKLLAIVDKAGVKFIRIDKPSRGIRRLYTFNSYIEALKMLIGDKPRNLKKVGRKEGWAYMGAITFTVSRELGDQFEVGEKLSKGLTDFWNRFSKFYDAEVLAICVLELQSDGYPHYHCIFWSSKPLAVFRHRGVWRFRDKRVWEGWYRCGFVDAFALRKLRHATNYLKKYLSKQFPSGSRESQDNSQNQLGEQNWKGWEIEYSYASGLRILRASRKIQELARELREGRLIRRSDIIEKKKLPVTSVGGAYIKIDSKALSLLARAFRNYVLASERHRNAIGVEKWIDHPSVQLYLDLINIIPNLDCSDPLGFGVYILDLRRGLDPPPDLWRILFEIWVVDSFTS